MSKKLVSVLLVVAFLVALVSCDSEESGVVIEPTVKVAVGTDSASSFLAAQEYTSANGCELLEYDSRESAVISVENGVADYVVISSDEITDEYLSSVSLEWVQDTEYKIEYCAYFNKNNNDLQYCFNQVIKEMKDDGVFESINEAKRKGESYAAESTAEPDGSLTILCAPIFDNRFSYNENGTLVGVEYDIIKEMCNYLDVKAELVIFKDVTAMFSALEKGEGDVVISSLMYTEERATQFLCSDIYAETTFGLYKSTL